MAGGVWKRQKGGGRQEKGSRPPVERFQGVVTPQSVAREGKTSGKKGEREGQKAEDMNDQKGKL